MGVEEAQVDVVGEAADDEEEVGIGGVDRRGALGDVLVPGCCIGVGGAHFVAEVHADDVGSALGEGGHGGEAGEPVGRVEVFGVVGCGADFEPAVAVVLGAAPGGLGDVVVEDHFDADGVERVDDGFVDVEHGCVGGDGRVGVDYGIVEVCHVGW